MRDLLLAITLFGSLPFIIWRPHIGVYVWSWISYMNPHRMAWGYLYDYPVAQLTGGATLAALVFSKEPKRIPWTPTTVLMVLLVLWMCLTTLFALVPDLAVEEWKRTMKIQVITFVTLMLITSRERLNWLVITIVASLGFYGVKGGLFTLLTGGEYRVWGPKESFIEGNNELGLALVMTIPLMIYLLIMAKRLWMKLAMFAVVGFSALAVLGSYSRGAFLAIAAMTIFLVLKSRRRVILLLLLAALSAVMINFMPEKWVDRMTGIKDYREDASAVGRINAWWYAFHLANDRPLVGGGFQAFEKELFKKYAPDPMDFHDAHSIYFEMLGEHGYVGLMLFLALGMAALLTGRWILRNTHDRPELKWAQNLAAMTQVSLVGYAAGGAFLGLAYFDLYYHLVAIMVMTRVVVEKALRPAPAPEARAAGAPVFGAQGDAIDGRQRI